MSEEITKSNHIDTISVPFFSEDGDEISILLATTETSAGDGETSPTTTIAASSIHFHQSNELEDGKRQVAEIILDTTTTTTTRLQNTTTATMENNDDCGTRLKTIISSNTKTEGRDSTIQQKRGQENPTKTLTATTATAVPATISPNKTINNQNTIDTIKSNLEPKVTGTSPIMKMETRTATTTTTPTAVNTPKKEDLKQQQQQQQQQPALPSIQNASTSTLEPATIEQVPATSATTTKSTQTQTRILSPSPKRQSKKMQQQPPYKKELAPLAPKIPLLVHNNGIIPTFYTTNPHIPNSSNNNNNMRDKSCINALLSLGKDLRGSAIVPILPKPKDLNNQRKKRPKLTHTSTTSAIHIQQQQQQQQEEESMLPPTQHLPDFWYWLPAVPTPATAGAAGEKPKTSTATVIRDWDVLCGRGGESNNHIGNKKYRKIVNERKEAYRTIPLKQRKLKTAFVKSIVQHVNNCGGRFVDLDDASGRYYVVTMEKARKKTSQALRETKELKWLEEEEEEQQHQQQQQQQQQQQPTATMTTTTLTTSKSNNGKKRESSSTMDSNTKNNNVCPFCKLPGHKTKIAKACKFHHEWLDANPSKAATAAPGGDSTSGNNNAGTSMVAASPSKGGNIPNGAPAATTSTAPAAANGSYERNEMPANHNNGSRNNSGTNNHTAFEFSTEYNHPTTTMAV